MLKACPNGPPAWATSTPIANPSFSQDQNPWTTNLINWCPSASPTNNAAVATFQQYILAENQCFTIIWLAYNTYAVSTAHLLFTERHPSVFRSLKVPKLQHLLTHEGCCDCHYFQMDLSASCHSIPTLCAPVRLGGGGSHRLTMAGSSLRFIENVMVDNNTPWYIALASTHSGARSTSHFCIGLHRFNSLSFFSSSERILMESTNEIGLLKPSVVYSMLLQFFWKDQDTMQLVFSNRILMLSMSSRSTPA